MSETTYRKTALVTGGSRGIGAATTLALAERGYDIAITYRNKAARAQDVVSQVAAQGQECLSLSCDITHNDELAALFSEIERWRGHLDVLVLNASGGMEKELLALNPDYPMLMNRDAQVALVDRALPLMPNGGTIVFVTSHWAHLYGRIQQLPSYGPVAESKHAGEQALRARLTEFSDRNIRLVVVTGDLIQGTITPKLLERAAPGLAAHRVSEVGTLPTATDMGITIAQAATDPTLPTGHTLVVGGTLDSLTPA